MHFEVVYYFLNHFYLRISTSCLEDVVEKLIAFVSQVSVDVFDGLR
jgi:hypothetical protein